MEQIESLFYPHHVCAIRVPKTANLSKANKMTSKLVLLFTTFRYCSFVFDDATRIHLIFVFIVLLLLLLLFRI